MRGIKEKRKQTALRLCAALCVWLVCAGCIGPALGQGVRPAVTPAMSRKPRYSPTPMVSRPPAPTEAPPVFVIIFYLNERGTLVHEEKRRLTESCEVEAAPEVLPDGYELAGYTSYYVKVENGTASPSYLEFKVRKKATPSPSPIPTAHPYYFEKASLSHFLTSYSVPAGSGHSVNRSGNSVQWILALDVPADGWITRAPEPEAVSWTKELEKNGVPAQAWERAKSGHTQYYCLTQDGGRTFSLHIYLPDDPSIAGEKRMVEVNGEGDRAVIYFDLRYEGGYDTGKGWSVSNVRLQNAAGYLLWQGYAATPTPAPTPTPVPRFSVKVPVRYVCGGVTVAAGTEECQAGEMTEIFAQENLYGGDYLLTGSHSAYVYVGWDGTATPGEAVFTLTRRATPTPRPTPTPVPVFDVKVPVYYKSGNTVVAAESVWCRSGTETVVYYDRSIPGSGYELSSSGKDRVSVYVSHDGTAIPASVTFQVKPKATKTPKATEETKVFIPPNLSVWFGF